MPPRPLKVFLCHIMPVGYAHADRDSVRGLYARLTQDGVDAWLDKAKLLPGQDWELEIRKAVREADVVVVCLSKQFNQAGFRQKEVRLALDTAMEKPEGEIFIIPARLEECDTLESLRRWHWVDLFEDDGYEMLMRALRARANRIGATLQIKKKEIRKVENAKQENRWQILFSAIRKISISFLAKNILPLLFALFAVVGAFYMLVAYIPKFSPTLFQAPTNDLTLISQPTPLSTDNFITATIFTPSSIPTKNFTPSETLLPTEITTEKGAQMVLVPAGNFIMGSDDSYDETYYSSDGYKPAHTVYLDAFYIDKYEVSNAKYKECVDEGKCDIPENPNSRSHFGYFGDPKYINYPILNVSWGEARGFCEWIGGQLPTEAQWEKAARGTDGRLYPWGNILDGEKANLDYEVEPVDSYPNGISVYGAFNMSGNADEWVNDWFDPEYYLNSPLNNPAGPSTGEYRVIRDGNPLFYRGRSEPLAYEYISGDPKTKWFKYIGFRCAYNITP